MWCKKEESRGPHSLDAIEQRISRRGRGEPGADKAQGKKMAAKAKAQSKKMNKIDAAIEAILADSHADLNDELESFGRAKTARLKYLQEQFQSRKLLRNHRFEQNINRISCA